MTVLSIGHAGAEGKRLSVAVELIDTRDGGVVWAEHFHGTIDDVHQMREEIRARILMALEIQIPIHEAALARFTVTENLDAWSAYHLGLQHMYRFNRKDNDAATAPVPTGRSAVIPVSPARTRAFPSSTSNRLYADTQTIAPAKSHWLGGSRRAASSSTR